MLNGIELKRVKNRTLKYHCYHHDTSVVHNSSVLGFFYGEKNFIDLKVITMWLSHCWYLFPGAGHSIELVLHTQWGIP